MLLSSDFTRSCSVEKADDAVLHFLVGAENRIAVVEHRLLEAGVLGADVVLDSSVVQDVPAYAGADRADEAARFEQLVEVLGLKTDRAGDGDVGIELRLRNSNPRGLRRGFPFGLPHVRPPRQSNSAGIPTTTSCGGSGNRAGRCDLLRQLVRRFSHQDAEAVLRHCGGRSAGLESATPSPRGSRSPVERRVP